VALRFPPHSKADGLRASLGSSKGFTRRLIGAAGVCWTLLPATLCAALNIVATIPDFGAIAREIGGDHVQVNAIARGTEDPHFVDAKPSHLRTLNRADLLLEGGADLEVGWLPALLQSARNAKILPGGSGHLSLAEGIRMLEVPAGSVDRSAGDVHPQGNPHFWLDPANGKVMAERIARRLSELDPAHAPAYAENLRRFQSRMDEKLAEWERRLKPLRGTRVVTYHKSFDYLLNRFGFELAGTIEPRPGIEPSASHINTLVAQMKAQQVQLILVEPFRPRRTPMTIADATGARLVLIPEMVGGVPEAGDFFGLFDCVVERLTAGTTASP
jgi:ABC-type Zn uptake system ZnuABC Zn-binding protein ZnuA